MIQEAIQKIAQMQQAAQPAKRFVIDDRDDLFYVDQGGKVAQLDLPVPPRIINGTDIRDFPSLLERYGENPAVLVGRAAVVGVLNDDGERDDRVNLALARTKAFQCLEAACAMKQRPFVEWLRSSLYELHPQLDGLIATCRKVSWGKSSDGTGIVQHTGQSISAAAKQHLQSDEGAIPETILLSVPVYEWPGFEMVPVEIACNVWVDAEQQQFALQPFAGEIVRAYRDAGQQIATWLRNAVKSAGEATKDVPVYLGEIK